MTTLFGDRSPRGPRHPSPTGAREAGVCLWLTGIPGAGKTTLAAALTAELAQVLPSVRRLDGDELRASISADLGFSPADRREHVRRTAELAGSLVASGTVVVAAIISPYRRDRDMARSIVEEHGTFREVFVDAPVDVCTQRDPKGLYRRAAAGEISGLTGFDAPYEAPTQPNVWVRTDLRTRQECVVALRADLLAANPSLALALG